LQNILDKLRNSSRHHLLSKRSRSGAMSYNSLKMIQYGNMTRENIISEGSGDAITLAVFKDSIHGYSIFLRNRGRGGKQFVC
jgi:hypothetical protein